MRFGDMLRQARNTKGLSQEELGAGTYPPHFVSLLERGQRQPTIEMVQHFATVLGMEAQTLSWWVEPPSSEDQPALATAMSAANYARDMQDAALAASEAEYAASLAYDQRNAPAWWDMSLLQAQSLITVRRPEEAETVLQRMDRSSLLVATPELRSVVLGRLSTIARSTGRLLEALDLAERSMDSASSLSEQSPTRLQAAFILIAALSVKGHLDAAWEVAMTLDISEEVPAVPSLLVARGAWAIGNVAFRRGEVEIGREQHALAARLLSPRADLEAWAEFHRASAMFTLQAGIADATVRDSLDKADAGARILQNPRYCLEVMIARAGLALLSKDSDTAWALLTEVNGRRDLLDFESTLDLEILLGNCLVAQGSTAQGALHLAAAARLCGEAGADEKARELTERVEELSA